MRALTLTQPWASLVMSGAKRVETRSWRTPVRGTIAIHAAKSWTFDDIRFAVTLIRDGTLDVGNVHDLPRGAVIGIIELLDVVHVEERPWDAAERRLGDFSPGRYAWLLDRPEAFDQPMLARGRLGLWPFDPS